VKANQCERLPGLSETIEASRAVGTKTQARYVVTVQRVKYFGNWLIWFS